MVLSDIPGTAFDKISMDIVRPLLITKSEYFYILTIQGLLTKYLVTVPLKQATLAEIAEAFMEKFINPYIARKAWTTDQGPNFISRVMCHIAHKYKISMYKALAYQLQSNGSIERSHHVIINRNLIVINRISETMFIKI